MTNKATAISKTYTKNQIITTIAEDTGLTKKDVGAVLDSLTVLVERHVKKRAIGIFTLPGLFKIKRMKKKATKARQGINPATGEAITISAKPATNVVRVTPLKALKDMVL